MIPQIHTFSDGYYVVEGLYIVPSEDVTEPTVNVELYDHVRSEYFDTDADAPMILRHQGGSYHFQVVASDNIPLDTVTAPFGFVDGLGVDRPPSEEQFLLMKPDHARIMTLSTTNTAQ